MSRWDDYGGGPYVRSWVECEPLAGLGGVGFTSLDGSVTDYAFAWPIEGGAWATLTGSYDLLDEHNDDLYVSKEMSRFGELDFSYQELIEQMTALEGAVEPEGPDMEPLGLNEPQVDEGTCR